LPPWNVSGTSTWTRGPRMGTLARSNHRSLCFPRTLKRT
jgi:hypothetical protein